MVQRCDIYSENVWDVTVARSIEDIEILRPTWKQMQDKEPCPNINADIDRFLSVIESSNGTIQPYVILIKKNELPAAIVLAQKEQGLVELRLGYKTLFGLKLRQLSVVHEGIIGQPDSDLCRSIISELMKVLYQDKLDAVYFDRLKKDSHLYRWARETPGVLSRGYFQRIESHWMITVPEDMEIFYKRFSSQRRSELKRYIRKIENSHSVRMVCYSREEDVAESCAKMQEISVKTYQHALGAGFADGVACRCLFNVAARKGWLKAHLLFVDDNPVAFQMGLQYGKVYFAQHIGFDPSWKQQRVGTVLFLKVFEELCKDSVSNFDFGFGDADYKQLYSDKSSPDASFYIFAKRFYPVSVNILQFIVSGVSLGLERCLRRLGLVSRVKRYWRDLLASKNTQKNDAVKNKE